MNEQSVSPAAVALYPYDLDGERREHIAERDGDKIWNVVCDHAPNMNDKPIDRYIEPPLEIERLTRLFQGDGTHLEFGMAQMFTFRPPPEISGNKGPVDGTCLTGASTDPGGGVWSAGGRGAAKVMLKVLR